MSPFFDETPADPAVSLVVIQGCLIEKIATEDGVFQLFGHNGKYAEAFVSFDDKQMPVMRMLTDLDRLAEYADACMNKWKWKRE